jgi:hypothetical protein
LLPHTVRLDILIVRETASPWKACRWVFYSYTLRP